MRPFRNPLAVAERAAIRLHARRLRRRARALEGAFAVAVVAAIPSAYALGMLAGDWACR